MGYLGAQVRYQKQFWCTDVLEQLSFSTIPSILTFEFVLIFYFLGLILGSGSKSVLELTDVVK